MSNTDQTKLQKLLKLIANENKFKIIRLLAQGEACVCDIGEKLGIEQSLVSHHLNSLREAGLINDRKLGTWTHCSLNRMAFASMTVLFYTYLSQNAISETMCSVHDECKCLTKGEKNEK
jgi:ArsR family transcriptional regulator